jgi:hypothetical protein
LVKAFTIGRNDVDHDEPAAPLRIDMSDRRKRGATPHVAASSGRETAR